MLAREIQDANLIARADPLSFEGDTGMILEDRFEKLLRNRSGEEHDHSDSALCRRVVN